MVCCLNVYDTWHLYTEMQAPPRASRFTICIVIFQSPYPSSLWFNLPLLVSLPFKSGQLFCLKPIVGFVFVTRKGHQSWADSVGE